MSNFALKTPGAPATNRQRFFLYRLCKVDLTPISSDRLTMSAASDYIQLAQEDPEGVRQELIEMGAKELRVVKGGNEAKIFEEAHEYAKKAALDEPQGNKDANGNLVEFDVVLSFEPGTSKMARYVKTYKDGESLGVGKPGIRMSIVEFGENIWQADAYATAFAKYMRLYHSDKFSVNVLHQK